MCPCRGVGASSVLARRAGWEPWIGRDQTVAPTDILNLAVPVSSCDAEAVAHCSGVTAEPARPATLRGLRIRGLGRGHCALEATRIGGGGSAIRVGPRARGRSPLGASIERQLCFVTRCRPAPVVLRSSDSPDVAPGVLGHGHPVKLRNEFSGSAPAPRWHDNRLAQGSLPQRLIDLRPGSGYTRTRSRQCWRVGRWCSSRCRRSTSWRIRQSDGCRSRVR